MIEQIAWFMEHIGPIHEMSTQGCYFLVSQDGSNEEPWVVGFAYQEDYDTMYHYSDWVGSGSTFEEALEDAYIKTVAGAERLLDIIARGKQVGSEAWDDLVPGKTYTAVEIRNGGEIVERKLLYHGLGERDKLITFIRAEDGKIIKWNHGWRWFPAALFAEVPPLEG